MEYQPTTQETVTQLIAAAIDILKNGAVMNLVMGIEDTPQQRIDDAMHYLLRAEAMVQQ